MYELTQKDIKLIASMDNFILDIDGCVYPRDENECGFFQQLSKNIKKSFVKVALNKGEFKGAIGLAKEAIKENPKFLTTIFSAVAKGTKEVLTSRFKTESDSFSKIEEVYNSIVPIAKFIKDNH